MILFIDNYDSFTYNLVQLAGGFCPDFKVVRNDRLTVKDIRTMAPSHIILSPGPGYPKDAGICEEVVTSLCGEIPILGICLGHQAICEAFGGEIVHAARLMHGKKSILSIQNDHPLFKGLPSKIDAARYHSLIARRDSLPNSLSIIAEDESGEVMAVSHHTYPVFGLQFHPESVLTPQGNIIMRNFLSLEV
jgi:anthranilate synthase component 2